jgi:hypothetical protein
MRCERRDRFAFCHADRFSRASTAVFTPRGIGLHAMHGTEIAAWIFYCFFAIGSTADAFELSGACCAAPLIGLACYLAT